MSAPGFWDDPEKAQDVGRKRARVEKRIAAGESIDTKSEELDVLLELQQRGRERRRRHRVARRAARGRSRTPSS